MLRRRWALSGLMWALLLGPLLARGQTAGRVMRIGYITERPGPGPREEAFRQALRDLGYSFGENVVIEERYSVRGAERLRTVAGELFRLPVDVLLAGGPTVTRGLREATRTIPIVMAQDSDPVANGFVASLGRPGGNITGLSILTTQLGGKRLQLLRELVPGLSRVTVLGDSDEPDHARSWRELEAAAKSLGVRLHYVEAGSPADIEAAFQTARAGQADAVMGLMSALLGVQRSRIAALALRHRIPVMWYNAEAVEAGILMSYGVNITDLFRRAAVYVDKILRGARPGDLPVEQPTAFELVINLRTARSIGLEVPPAVLANADRIIE